MKGRDIDFIDSRHIRDHMIINQSDRPTSPISNLLGQLKTDIMIDVFLNFLVYIIFSYSKLFYLRPLSTVNRFYYGCCFYDKHKSSVFDQRNFNIIDLKRKCKCADLNSVHVDIIKTIDLKDATEEYLPDRSDILIINEKIINRKAGIWTRNVLMVTEKLKIMICYQLFNMINPQILIVTT